MALVVDAAVTSKWVLQEADGPLAEALLSRAEDLFVPDFRLHQARNVLWVEVHRRTTQNQSWTAAEAQTGLHLLWEAVSPTPTHDKGLHTIALDIALAIDHSP